MTFDFSEPIEREFPDGWVEIKQTEYKLLKRLDPHNCNGYTCRILFRYYKKKDAGIKTPLKKVVEEAESEWDNLTASQQESLKEYLRTKLKEIIN